MRTKGQRKRLKVQMRELRKFETALIPTPCCK